VWNLDIRRNSAPCFSKIAFASLAVLTISSYTGLRIGDVATLGRQHLKQRTIVIEGQPVRRTVTSIDSEKTGMRVELPLLPQLEATLEAGPTRTWPSSSPGAARRGPRALWGPNL